MSPNAIISNSLAGLLMAVLNITVAISVAALIFVEAEGSYLSVGVMVLLVGSAVVGLGGTLLSGFPGVICGARVAFAPIVAAMVGNISSVIGSDPTVPVLPTMLAVIMATSVVTGAFLLLLGRLKLGNLVRYIPYPVMGGFLAGIGFILIEGGLTVAIGETPGMDTLSKPHLIQLGMPTFILGLLLYFLLARFGHWLTFPAVLVAAFVAFHVVLIATGQDLDIAAQTGWLPWLGEVADASLLAFSPSRIAEVDWTAVFAQFGGIAVVAVLAAMILLLDTAAIELITRRDLSPDKELKAMGATNIVAGVLGGYPGVHVASDTALTRKVGGDSRLMGFVYAGAIVLAIAMGTEFIGVIPAFILGAMLVYLGIDFLVDWIWKTRKLFATPDYLIVVAICVVVASVGVLEGVMFGFVLAVVFFVVSYSKLSVIRNIVSGSEYTGSVDRDLETRKKLNEHGRRVLIVTLQGFIFFGTSDKLLNELRGRLRGNGGGGIDFLVLDFRHVSDLDISAIQTFSRLAQLSDTAGFHVVVTGVRPEWTKRLVSVEFLREEGPWKRLRFDDLADGVTWCEEIILQELDIDSAGSRKDLVSLLSVISHEPSRIDELKTYFSVMHLSQDEHLFRQGDAGRALYIVAEGSVAVVLESAGRRRVLRRYRSGAFVGEMALYTGEPRSASVIAEQDSLLYRLTAEQFASMTEDHPEAAGLMHGYIVRLLAERLGRSNRELQYV